MALFLNCMTVTFEMDPGLQIEYMICIWLGDLNKSLDNSASSPRSAIAKQVFPSPEKKGDLERTGTCFIPRIDYWTFLMVCLYLKMATVTTLLINAVKKIMPNKETLSDGSFLKFFIAKSTNSPDMNVDEILRKSCHFIFQRYLSFYRMQYKSTFIYACSRFFDSISLRKMVETKN